MWIQVFGSCSVIVIAAYLYVQLRWRSCKSNARLDGKVVVITGSTSGIGKETAIDMARRGAKVIMPCLYLEEGKRVRDELIRLTGNANIVVYHLDLASLKSIREFAIQLHKNEDKIDILINNAGVGYFRCPKKVTEDNIETTMAINYFGPFLLTHLLIDLVKKSKQSRIVFVASVAYLFGYINLNELNSTRTYSFRNYCISKYAVVIFTRESARRLRGTGITVNCLHPGIVDTEIWNGIFAPPFSWILTLFRKTCFKSSVMGAQTTIHVAVSEELEGISGKLFCDCQEWGLFGKYDADAKAEKLWELSEEIVKLSPTDPRI